MFHPMFEAALARRARLTAGGARRWLTDGKSAAPKCVTRLRRYPFVTPADTGGLNRQRLPELFGM